MIDFLKRNLAVAIVVAVVLGAGAVAWAQEAPQDPQPGDPAPPAANAPESDQPKPPPDGEGRRHHRGPGPGKFGPAGMLAGHAVHGDLVVRTRDGDFEEVTFDRGTVRQQGSGYSLERPDGKTVTVKLTDSTKFRGIENASEIRVGEPAFVVSEKNGDARMFAQKPEREARNKPAEGSVTPSEEQVPAA